MLTIEAITFGSRQDAGDDRRVLPRLAAQDDGFVVTAAGAAEAPFWRWGSGARTDVAIKSGRYLDG
ncbi:hypothetical protein [Micromonospora musae]|uniref:hypothetical protein n=1 Tax=Micromonospora musae TaxID=1894970 RepID=UPI0033D22310